MSDFFNPEQSRKARIGHICSYCGESIKTGETYIHQTGVYEGRWYTSKMHPECFDDMAENGDGEYMPHSNERPTTEPTSANPAVEPASAQGEKP